MLLGRKKGKPKKKKRNAKSRYDKEYPVVTIRLHRTTKKQLLKEAKKKDLMLSQYIRGLLLGMEVREHVVERTVEKPVAKTVVRTIENSEKKMEIAELKRTVRSMKETIFSQKAELAESSRKCSEQQEKIKRLEKSLTLLSEKHRRLEEQHTANIREIQAEEKEIVKLRTSMSAKLDTLSNRCQHADEHVERLQNEVEDLSRHNSKLNTQLEWALDELRTNDTRNKAIAQKIANIYNIRVPLVCTSWDQMPQE